MNIYCEDEFKIGWCPICNQGWVTIQKDAIDNRLFIQCEECLSVWKDPEDFKTPSKATFGGVVQVNHKNSVPLSLIETPTCEEIKKHKWDKFLIECD